MRINISVEVFLNPEILYREKIDNQQAMAMLSASIEDAVNDMGEIIGAFGVITKVVKEGPSAAN